MARNKSASEIQALVPCKSTALVRTKPVRVRKGKGKLIMDDRMITMAVVAGFYALFGFGKGGHGKKRK